MKHGAGMAILKSDKTSKSKNIIRFKDDNYIVIKKYNLKK